MATKKTFLLIFLALCLGGCASKTPPTEEGQAQYPDPYERYNRNTFRLNDKLDRAIFKPVATAYTKVTPSVARAGVGNFFNNLGTIPTIGNDLAQGRGHWFAHDFARLLINSTVGVLGLMDVAKKVGLGPHVNTFGLTLTDWGAKPQPYLMLPMLGPGTVADVVGMAPDLMLSPWFLVDSWDLAIALFLLKSINTRAYLLQNESLINQVSIDPYLFMRSAYLQYRTRLLWLNANPPNQEGGDNQEDEVYTGE
jgi:phospholipid-binding lipoprotein MlaA